VEELNGTLSAEGIDLEVVAGGEPDFFRRPRLPARPPPALNRVSRKTAQRRERGLG